MKKYITVNPNGITKKKRERKKTMRKHLITILLQIIAIIGLSVLSCWLGMIIFNWVMTLFGCSFTLNFLQALGIYLLFCFVRGFFRK